MSTRQVFCSGHLGSGFKGERYGLPWEEGELNKLRDLFHKGHSLNELCALMERPPLGIVPKLRGLGCIYWDETDRIYYRNEKPNAPSTTPAYKTYTTRAQDLVLSDIQPSIKEKQMIDPKNCKVITKTFIGDKEADRVTNEEIFVAIGQIENEIARWMQIENRPMALNQMIASKQDDIKALIALVDARVK